MSLSFRNRRFAAILVGAGALLAQAGKQLPAPYATPSATKFPNAVGWGNGAKPKAPDGFIVDRFAGDLHSPRWLYVLPNGDVLASQAKTKPRPNTDPEKEREMREARMVGQSPDRITLFRDANGDGHYETRRTFLTGLNQPFGMLLLNGKFYVANTDSVMRYAYQPGQDKIDGQGVKILDLPAGGYNNHWTRNIIAKPDGSKLYVTVGSATNVDEEGQDAKEPRRAAILECDPDGSNMRIFASGLRNPNGMDWAPATGQLWTVVNERDGLGDSLPPDYLTSVKDGGFYGWPYSYWGQNVDPRKKGARPDLVSKAIVPDMSMGAHTASLGLVFYRAEAFPSRYRGGAFIGQHGSWNRSKFSGYAVQFVPFRDGKPSGPMEEFLTGFIASEADSQVYGRPVGLAVLKDGSLLVADDAGDTIWRVRFAAQQ